jgi:DNA-binding NarL/FixJ family response regulator
MTVDSPTMTILTIDDEENIRQSIRDYLEDCDFNVIEAASGPEGLEALSTEKPDLVLLDLRMPEMDGLEVLRIMTESSPNVPVIVISGVGVITDAVAALRLGAWDYLIKPIEDMSILRHAVDMALERARLLLENRRYREHLEEEVSRRTEQISEQVETIKRKNIALQELLNTFQTQKRKVEQKIASNLESVVLPMLLAHKQGLSGIQKNVVTQIQQVLTDIASPLVAKLSRSFTSLTPREVRICQLIRQGLGIKETAQIEGIAPNTVRTHRRNIRRKLGIANNKVNLRTYLMETMGDESQQESS